eukprot:458949-Alexandrium_andersonii.AAC.1
MLVSKHRSGRAPHDIRGRSHCHIRAQCEHRTRMSPWRSCLKRGVSGAACALEALRAVLTSASLQSLWLTANDALRVACE